MGIIPKQKCNEGLKVTAQREKRAARLWPPGGHAGSSDAVSSRSGSLTPEPPPGS